MIKWRTPEPALQRVFNVYPIVVQSEFEKLLECFNALHLPATIKFFKLVKALPCSCYIGI